MIKTLSFETNMKDSVYLYPVKKVSLGSALWLKTALMSSYEAFSITRVIEDTFGEN